MSTKNISRSSLEGGRYNYNKYERNASHRHERSRLRSWLSNVRKDVEYAEECLPELRDPVHKGFTDKLNPAYRWLASRCERPWSEVYSELKKKFDTRSLASWHIVNQHMLAEVQGAGSEQDGGSKWHHQRFFIDENDILRDRGEDSYYYRKKKLEGPRREWVKDKVGHRVVFDDGDTQYWGVRAELGWIPCTHGIQVNQCQVHADRHRSFELEPTGWIKKKYKDRGEKIPGWAKRFRYEHYDWSVWRRSRQFSEGEAKWWGTICEKIREAHTVNA